MKKNKTIFIAIPILVILFPLGYSLGAFVFSHGAQKSQAFLEMPDAKYKKCVRETSYMRFHHMDLLKQIRDESVRKGKIGEVAFKNCRECHPNRERFCNQCHKAVNLDLGCFDCHYYPLKAEKKAEASGG